MLRCAFLLQSLPRDPDDKLGFVLVVSSDASMQLSAALLSCYNDCTEMALLEKGLLWPGRFA